MMQVLTDIGRRLVVAIPTLIGATLALFLVLMVGPNPLTLLSQESDVDTSALAHHYGWDRPWYVQYLDWLGGLLHGDWGESLRTQESARDMILDRLPVTLAIAGCSTLLAVVLAVWLGAWTAQRRDSRSDRVATATMIGLGALPAFLLALILQWGAVQLRDLTGTTIVYVGGMPREGGFLELVQRFALPILVLAVVQAAGWMRFQRSELIDALDDDAMVAARGRGVPDQLLLRRHAFPRTVAPLLTLVALELGTLVGGTVIIETVFGLPGLGRLLLESLQTRDVAVALDIVALGAVAIVVATAIADSISAHIDPRVSRHAQEAAR